MICKSCGTEIADKALICFRCGTPTSSPVAAPRPPARRGMRGLLAVLGLVLLVLAALFLGQAGQLDIPPAVSYSLAALVAAILVWRLARRRRR
jgi:hypothetical protein